MFATEPLVPHAACSADRSARSPGPAAAGRLALLLSMLALQGCALFGGASERSEEAEEFSAEILHSFDDDAIAGRAQIGCGVTSSDGGGPVAIQPEGQVIYRMGDAPAPRGPTRPEICDLMREAGWDVAAVMTLIEDDDDLEDDEREMLLAELAEVLSGGQAAKRAKPTANPRSATP